MSERESLKPMLVWRDGEARSKAGDLYSVHKMSEHIWQTHWNGTEICRWRGTEQEAQAEAELHLAASISTEPMAQESGEVVAWRYAESDTEWGFTDEKTKADRLAEIVTVEPLYASPASPSEEVTVSEREIEAALTAWYGGVWPATSPDEAQGMRDDMRAALLAALQTRSKQQ